MYKLLAQAGRMITSSAISADIEDTRRIDAKEYLQHAEISRNFAIEKLQDTLSTFDKVKQIATKATDKPVRVVR